MRDHTIHDPSAIRAAPIAKRIIVFCADPFPDGFFSVLSPAPDASPNIEPEGDPSVCFPRIDPSGEIAIAPVCGVGFTPVVVDEVVVVDDVVIRVSLSPTIPEPFPAVVNARTPK